MKPAGNIPLDLRGFFYYIIYNDIGIAGTGQGCDLDVASAVERLSGRGPDGRGANYCATGAHGGRLCRRGVIAPCTDNVSNRKASLALRRFDP